MSEAYSISMEACLAAAPWSPALRQGQLRRNNVAYCRRQSDERVSSSGGFWEGRNVLTSVRRRRDALFLGLGMLGSSMLSSSSSSSRRIALARDVEVGVYLPPDESHPGFVQFKATNKDTPALRAGNVQPYEFILPAKWKQERIANILSGNYCQPKCAEPWVEVKFDDPKEGSLQVIAAPMVRLTNRPNSKIEDIGSPDKIIAALGPFVTGNSYDPDEVVDSYVTEKDGQTFYCYTLETPYAKTGAYNLATATAKGNAVVLFVVSADDKQWSSSQDTLKTILASFKV